MKQRYIIAAAAFIAIVTAWFFLLAAPELHKKQELTAEITDSADKLNNLKRIMLEIPGYYRMQQELLNEKHLLISKLYSREDLIKLFDEFAQKAQLNRLELVEISPSIEELLELNKTIPDENSPRMLDITLKLRGTLSSTGEFIASIEHQNFYKGLNHCRITNPVEKRPFSDVTYSFRAVLGTIKDS